MMSTGRALQLPPSQTLLMLMRAVLGHCRAASHAGWLVSGECCAVGWLSELIEPSRQRLLSCAHAGLQAGVSALCCILTACAVGVPRRCANDNKCALAAKVLVCVRQDVASQAKDLALHTLRSSTPALNSTQKLVTSVLMPVDGHSTRTWGLFADADRPASFLFVRTGAQLPSAVSSCQPLQNSSHLLASSNPESVPGGQLTDLGEP